MATFMLDPPQSGGMSITRTVNKSCDRIFCQFNNICNESSSNMSDDVDSSSRDAMAEGLIGLLRPAVEEVDDRVRAVRQSQMDLRTNIDALADDLKRIQDRQQVPIELDGYVKKLNNARRRVMLVNNILQNAQERLGKLHFHVSKETARRKALLDPPSPGPPQ